MTRRLKAKKGRIDALVVEKGLADSIIKARSLIMARMVLADNEVVDKPGTAVSADSDIVIKDAQPFVGRGGVKLAGALDAFNLDVAGLRAMDVGSSTGGFTDCLLKRGATKVFAIDVGTGLIDFGLRNDPRVVVLEGRNIRHMPFDDVGCKVDLCVIDVSFISLEKVLPAIKVFLKDSASVIALIKPQFEVQKGEVGKGGIVKDAAKHLAVIERIKEFSIQEGFKVVGTCDSPITGAKGNKEFWIYLRYQ